MPNIYRKTHAVLKNPLQGYSYSEAERWIFKWQEIVVHLTLPDIAGFGSYYCLAVKQ